MHNPYFSFQMLIDETKPQFNKKRQLIGAIVGLMNKGSISVLKFGICTRFNVILFPHHRKAF